jgi:NAD(P)-dependent dehydrogenase (short-subunit alcohol dehydrogenase family)
MGQTRWTAADLPDLNGRTVIVTGASSGIGESAARGLAYAGARVVLAVRDTARGDLAAERIRGNTEVRGLDLADLASVRAFAGEWDEPLDILINNAGIMAVPKAYTADGFELQIGTNHLGHFALTQLLLPQITGRVVNIASAAAQRGHIDLDDLNWEHRRYRRWGAYAQSKLANLLFTFELDTRLRDAGSEVLAVAAHPGVAATGLFGRGVVSKLVRPVVRVASGSSADGALPTLFAATQDLAGGMYIGPDDGMTTKVTPVPATLSEKAIDPVMASGLWELSEQLTRPAG